MLWLKRNLFLVFSGALALALGGGALYYLVKSVNRNASVEKELEEMMNSLEGLYRMDPFPADTNIVAAQKEVEKLREAVTQGKQFFAPIPEEQVRGLEFKTLLDNTIFELTQKAEASSIELPDEPYFFSFAAQKEKLNLSPQCFPAINGQLADVKTLCDILFAARVHSLNGLKRVRLTDDDPVGSKDYSDHLKYETNAVGGGVVTPYEITFVGFSTELASVLEGLVRSPHGLIVRAMRVERFVEKVDELAPGAVPVPRQPGFRPPPPPVSPTESQTVLDEERFQVSLLVVIVKPTS